MHDLGVTISEFPVTLSAAEEARRRGLWTLMGAPNALRGQSMSGNLECAGCCKRRSADGHRRRLPSGCLRARHLQDSRSDRSPDRRCNGDEECRALCRSYGSWRDRHRPACRSGCRRSRRCTPDPRDLPRRSGSSTAMARCTSHGHSRPEHRAIPARGRCAAVLRLEML